MDTTDWELKSSPGAPALCLAFRLSSLSTSRHVDIGISDLLRIKRHNKVRKFFSNYLYGEKGSRCRFCPLSSIPITDSFNGAQRGGSVFLYRITGALHWLAKVCKLGGRVKIDIGSLSCHIKRFLARCDYSDLDSSWHRKSHRRVVRRRPPRPKRSELATRRGRGGGRKATAFTSTKF